MGNNVLYVEDNPDNMMLVQRALEARGYRLLKAANGLSGVEVAERMMHAYEFAAADPYRAATHNKGIMNGIDAVAVATGNDWRAIEAGAHAYACRNGAYRSLTTWSLEDGSLVGTIEVPMAVSTVGPLVQSHPRVRLALRLLGVSGARELAAIMAAVGLLNENPGLSEDEIRHGLEGNLCRCTGYHNIVKAVAAVASA